MERRIKSLEWIQESAEENDWDDVSKKNINDELQGLYEARALSLKQKACLNWGSFGNRNTRFFHSCVIRRRKRYKIMGISHNGTWISNPQEIKEVFRSYFDSLFAKE